ncbi:MAG TPA: FHA domain-containing protein [Pirellulales bacterium]|nr:FHA domain-containing protein [Pirellulales bacterium]
MSFVRIVYYSALAGGWGAFAGWLLAEILFFRSGVEQGTTQATAVGAIVGAGIGLGLSAVAALACGRLSQVGLRGLPGIVGGGFGGAVGSFVGNVIYSLLPLLGRAPGWMVVGIGIGMVEGLYERSASKLRNGLIGGALGGLLGGVLFDVIQKAVVHGSGMASRAAGFVVLGIAIGALIGLVQVVLKDAWLTVLDGYRPGRQLILSRAVTALGRGDHLPLPFLGPMNAGIESEHLRIVRQASGAFVLEDNQSKLGTRLNNQPVAQPMPLKDGDVIKFGTNFVRFNERRRSKDQEPLTPAFQGQVRAAPPPPPVRKHTPPPPQPAVVPKPSPVSSPVEAKSEKPVVRPAAHGSIPLPPPPRKKG